MTNARAQRIVIGSAAVLLVVSWAQDVAKGNVPDARPLLGAAFMAITLSIASEFAPDIAAMFAILIVGAVLVQIDPKVWRGVNRALGGVKLSPANPAGAPRPPIVNEDGSVASKESTSTKLAPNTPQTVPVPLYPN